MPVITPVNHLILRFSQHISLIWSTHWQGDHSMKRAPRPATPGARQLAIPKIDGGSRRSPSRWAARAIAATHRFVGTSMVSTSGVIVESIVDNSRDVMWCLFMQWRPKKWRVVINGSKLLFMLGHVYLAAAATEWANFPQHLPFSSSWVERRETSMRIRWTTRLNASARSRADVSRLMVTNVPEPMMVMANGRQTPLVSPWFFTRENSQHSYVRISLLIGSLERLFRTMNIER